MCEIAVVIPMYNAEKTIEISIESVVNDLLKCNCLWEIIVVNDGSKDASLEVILSYWRKSFFKDRIKIINQPNKGAAFARNKGIEKSNSKYIAFNDADDVWLEGKTNKQIEYLESNGSVDMIAGAHDVQYTSFFKLMPKEKRITLRMLVFKNFFAPPTVVIRRSSIENLNIYFDSSMRCGAEESSLFHPLSFYGKCILVNDIVAESITAKKKWGESGLSGNIYQMEKGELYNLRKAYKNKYISTNIFFLSFIFSLIKYSRRFLIKIINKYVTK